MVLILGFIFVFMFIGMVTGVKWLFAGAFVAMVVWAIVQYFGGGPGDAIGGGGGLLGRTGL